MKKTEVTVESLKRLGYTAKQNFINTWRFANEEKELDQKSSDELFAVTVQDIRSGSSFEIRRNNRRHTVEVTIRRADWKRGAAEMYYYLSRPMTEAEVFEANQSSGNWDVAQ